MTEAEHRRFIRERQASSEGWRVIHLLGSLKLAVFLLISIALACAVATFAESKFSIKVAKYYIYEAPWFTLWLLALVANLACAALTRWPWQRKHLGFVVTHSGIILMLFGAMIGREFGFEGTTTLKKAGEPSGMLVIDETIFLVESPDSGMMYEIPLPVEVRVPHPDRPRVLEVPDSDYSVEILDYAENLTVRAQVEADPAQSGPAGIELEMFTAMMNQTMNIPMALAPVETRNFDLMGRARIEWMEKLPPVVRTKKKVAPEYRETQMIFARMPESPVWHNTLGKASGLQFRLEVNPSGEGTVRILHPGGSSEVRPLKSVLDKPFTDAGTGAKVHVTRYWPDLRMVDGQPVSASDQPNNPAVLITLTGKMEMQGASVPVLRMAPNADGSVFYHLLRGTELVGQGRVRAGDAFMTGWADWKATLKAYYPHARIRTVAEKSTGVGGDGAIPGIRAALVKKGDKRSEPVWIPSGTSKVLEIDGQAVRAGFGLKTHKLDFLVALEDFQVPRDEGTDTPANFISSVRFDGTATPGPVRATVEMNTPASYPPGWWGALTGLNYKFSQAGWDPNELDTTTLQVLFDPGWSFKWMGSLLICGGIFIMFYLKPKSRPGSTPEADSPLLHPTSSPTRTPLS
jgi:hypothetical protein